MSENQVTPVVGLVSVAWQLSRLAEQAFAHTPLNVRQRLEARLRFLESELRRAMISGGMEFADFTGQAYSEGVPLSIVNLEDFESTDSLYVSQMVEPTITSNGRVVALGKAAVARRED